MSRLDEIEEWITGSVMDPKRRADTAYLLACVRAADRLADRLDEWLGDACPADCPCTEINAYRQARGEQG